MIPQTCVANVDPGYFAQPARDFAGADQLYYAKATYPCMEANSDTFGAQVPPLFVSTEWVPRSIIWTAKLSQCSCTNKVCDTQTLPGTT